MKNLISFFEIPATDISRAVNFYNELFGFEIKISDCGEEKMAFFPGEDNNVCGAISQAKNFEPSAQGVLIHFDVTGRIDDLITKVPELGGKIVMGKTQIVPEDQGCFALVLDSEGNRIGLHSN